MIRLFDEKMEKIFHIPKKINQLTGSVFNVNNSMPTQISTQCPTPRSVSTKRQFRPTNSLLLIQKKHNGIQMGFLSVRREPLRPISKKQQLKSEISLAKSHYHEHVVVQRDYFEQGKIVHRQVDWIRYNIMNCMISQWIKNQKNYSLMSGYFQDENGKSTKDKDKNSQAQEYFRIKINQKRDKGNDFTQDYIKHLFKYYYKNQQIKQKDERNIQDYINGNFSKQQGKQIKNIFSLIFKGKGRQNSNQVNQNTAKKNFPSENKTKVDGSNSKKADYKSLVNQQFQNQFIDKVALRIKTLNPALIQFSRKIILQKQQQLLTQILSKNQKLQKNPLQKLKFQERVGLFQKILQKRMQSFDFLKNNFNQLGKNAQLYMNQHQKLIEKCYAQGLINKVDGKQNNLTVGYNKMGKKIFTVGNSYNSNLNNQYDEFFRLIVESFKYSNVQNQTDKNQSNQRLVKLGTTAFKNVAKFTRKQNIKYKKRDNYNKQGLNSQRYSLQNFISEFSQSRANTPQRINKMTTYELIRQSQNHNNNILEINTQDKEGLLMKKRLKYNRQKSRFNTSEEQNLSPSGFNIFNSKEQQPIISKSYNKFSPKPSTTMTRRVNATQTPKKPPTSKPIAQHLSKQQPQPSYDKNKFFLKYHRQKMHNSKTNQRKRNNILKLFHSKNRNKIVLNPSSNNNQEQAIIKQTAARKRTIANGNSDAAENSVVVEKQQQVKTRVKRNEPKRTDNVFQPQKPAVARAPSPVPNRQKKLQRKQLLKRSQKQKERSIKIKHLPQENKGAKQQKVKVNKIKRIKFSNLKFIPKKLIKMILGERSQIEKQKNSIFLREKIIGYFKRLLQAGVLDEGQLKSYKQSVQDFTRAYDYKRHTISIKKSLVTENSLETHPHNNCSPNDSFNINVKLHHRDPFIFQTLASIQQFLSTSSHDYASSCQLQMINKSNIATQITQQQLYQKCKKNKFHGLSGFDLECNENGEQNNQNYDFYNIDDLNLNDNSMNIQKYKQRRINKQTQSELHNHKQNDEQDEIQMLKFMKTLISKTSGILMQKSV